MECVLWEYSEQRSIWGDWLIAKYEPYHLCRVPFDMQSQPPLREGQKEESVGSFDLLSSS